VVCVHRNRAPAVNAARHGQGAQPPSLRVMMVSRELLDNEDPLSVGSPPFVPEPASALPSIPELGSSERSPLCPRSGEELRYHVGPEPLQFHGGRPHLLRSSLRHGDLVQQPWPLNGNERGWSRPPTPASPLALACLLSSLHRRSRIPPPTSNTGICRQLPSS
jgi:hypothetical protein